MGDNWDNIDLYSTDYVSISYSPNGLFIQALWKGVISSADFRKTVKKELEYLEKYNLYKIIIDISEFQGSSRPDREYCSKLFKNYTDAKGIRIHAAFVVGKENFGSISIEKILGRVDETSAYLQIFDNLEDAIFWITES
ncbi:hypothetical protein QQ008_19380 [Fulvivirgaceae bacterium BMA10]|uniref:STAS/SEC14 domain-containing protein n=1 Tax=Splendidivirga corallicola TaxID=3051826 RepID=A0ABT8KS39_9BACT|nr:hypothetical protein [Fulvivirgaceae bacterium BMA10]